MCWHHYLLLLYRANLYEFAEVLINHGVVNAINLDGGGSNTLVKDGVLINYPTDHWYMHTHMHIHTESHTDNERRFAKMKLVCMPSELLIPASDSLRHLAIKQGLRFYWGCSTHIHVCTHTLLPQSRYA